MPQQLLDENALLVGMRGDDVHYVWRHFGSLLIRAGREIYYDPLPNAPEESVRAPLVGVAFGTLLHQRGLFTLHASAVQIDGGAVAFVGVKGAGKSTTSACLNKRGHALVTDDVLALDFSEGGPPQAWPAFPNLKLCPDSILALGEDPNAHRRLHPEIQKHVRPAGDGFRHEALPLKAIYVLETGPAVSVRRLSQKEALVQLLTHSYAARFMGADAAGPRHFMQCQAIARQVPVFALQRTDDLSSLPELASIIENN